jgi:hypothetical protein
MSITINDIRSAPSDEALMDSLLAELNSRIPAELLSQVDCDEFVAHLNGLPPGLRAMAATHQLDVSMVFDDLGWHFANWHHKPYCEETSRGLRELGATDVAQIFDEAYRLVLPHWDAISGMLAINFGAFREWYRDSDLDKALLPLNSRLWEICEAAGYHRLGKYWLDYARKYPERVVG